MKLMKYLKGFTLPLIFLVIILGVRVVAELELPTYTSNIVDIGIQQKGIKDAVPNKISEKSLNTLELFMTDDEVKKVKDNYKKEGNFYKLNNIPDDVRKELNDIFKETMTVVLGAKKQNTDLTQVEQGVKLGIVDKGTLIDQRKKTVSSLGNASDMMLKQAGISFVKEEYSEVGIDTNEIRNSYLKEVGLMMIFMTFISGLGSIISNFISSRIASRVAFNLREKLYNKVLSFSKQDIDKFSTASLITRSTNDIQQIQNALNMFLFIAFYAPMMALWGIYKVTQTDTGMTWIIAVGVGLLGLLLGIITFLVMPKFKIMQKLVDRVNLVTRELLTGISVIRVFGREKHEEERFDKENVILRNNQLFVNRTMSALFPAIILIMNGISLLIIWVGGKNIDAGSIQVGDMMAFITYTMQIVMSFLFFTFLMMQLPRAEVAASRIDEVLGTDITVLDNENIQDDKLSSVHGALKFEDVSFTFDGADSPVLSNITFEAEAGKTTMVKLLMRFYDINGGKISIDGRDITSLSREELRSYFTMVLQDTWLFRGTIMENIRYGRLDATDEEVIEAAKAAHIHHFIKTLPGGYNMELNEEASNISQGQKQLLTIARAILANKPILILDEATSSVDTRTEVLIQKAMNKLMEGRTTFVIAHRLSTIRNADKILVLKDGDIIEQGNHNELLEQKGFYSELYQSQFAE